MTTAQASGRVEIRLLGPVEARVDGEPARLGGPRPRALLSVLALSAGTAVATSRLIESMWEGDPPPAAANTIQVYVSRLRRVLIPREGTCPLRAASSSYQLDLPAEAVDALRFERLAAQGHTHLLEDDVAAAAQVLREALELWRGPALPDLDGLPAGAAVIARLDALRLSALADRFDADSALGRHATIVPELEELVRLHPLDERLVGQLMTALYRSGRQADALSAYQAAARRLGDELGVDPGPALRELHTEVLRQDAALIPAPRPAVPATPGPDTPPAPGEPPAPPVVPSPRPQPPSRPGRRAMPRPVTPLVGRAEELDQALALLVRPDVRLVTLLGTGGIGKTRLALAIAERLAGQEDLPGPDPPPDLVFVPLAAVTDPADLLPAICRAAGASPDWAGEPPLDVAVRALGGQRCVLVLDNLEQLVGAAGTLPTLCDLLAGLPEVTVLCTSRTALRLRGEHLLGLQPLPLPDPSAEDAGSVLRSDAVQLFRARAQAVLPIFEVTPENAATVAAVCRMLDGLPLALELAAARVRVLPPEEMLRRVGQRLRLLTGGDGDLPERQRSIRAALDWSFQLLEPAEARLFAELAVFSGGWTLDAAEAVCWDGGPDGDGDDVLGLLDRLVDRSLVVADGSGRLTMLDVVREYAAEVLAGEAPGRDATGVRDRHARYYAALAEELGPTCRTSPDSSTRARLDAELGNLDAALDHAVSSGDAPLLARLVLGLLDYWYYSGQITTADRWMRVAGSAELPGELRARMLFSAGNIAFVEGDLGRGEAALAGAHAAAVEHGDDVLLARTLVVLGIVARHAGRLEEAQARVEEALALARAAGAEDLVPQLENEVGELLDEVGRTEEALPLWEAYRDWSARDGRATRQALALVNLAVHAHARGDGGATRELVAAALEAAERGGSAPVQGDVLAAAGLLELQVGRPGGAVRLLREAIALGHASGQLLTLPDMVSVLGAALLAADEPRTAARLLAAGRAWRSARGLAVVGRLTRQTIAEAEARLAVVLTAEQLAAEEAAGSRTAYGSLAGLRSLGALPPGRRVLDVREISIDIKTGDPASSS